MGKDLERWGQARIRTEGRGHAMKRGLTGVRSSRFPMSLREDGKLCYVCGAEAGRVMRKCSGAFPGHKMDYSGPLNFLIGLPLSSVLWLFHRLDCDSAFIFSFC